MHKQNKNQTSLKKNRNVSNKVQRNIKEHEVDTFMKKGTGPLYLENVSNIYDKNALCIQNEKYLLKIRRKVLFSSYCINDIR